MMMVRLIYCCLTGALLVILGCSPDIAGTGSGTQTTNGICIASHDGTLSGYVFTVDPHDSLKKIPTGAVSASLQLFSSGYQPYGKSGLCLTMVADSSGNFDGDTLLSGKFTLLAYDTSEDGGLFICDIPIGDSIRDYTVHKLFTPCGTVQGTIHDISLMQSDRTGAYINGTPFFELTDSTGAFFFRHVPVGVYTIRSDYFSLLQGRNYRVKGSISILDTLVIYTDSIEVDVRCDSLVHRVELSL